MIYRSCEIRSLNHRIALKSDTPLDSITILDINLTASGLTIRRLVEYWNTALNSGDDPEHPQHLINYSVYHLIKFHLTRFLVMLLTDRHYTSSHPSQRKDPCCDLRNLFSVQNRLWRQPQSHEINRMFDRWSCVRRTRAHFANVFEWFKFHWNIFLWDQLTVRQRSICTTCAVISLNVPLEKRSLTMFLGTC